MTSEWSVVVVVVVFAFLVKVGNGTFSILAKKGSFQKQVCRSKLIRNIKERVKLFSDTLSGKSGNFPEMSSFQT